MSTSHKVLKVVSGIAPNSPLFGRGVKYAALVETVRIGPDGRLDWNDRPDVWGEGETRQEALADARRKLGRACRSEFDALIA